MLDLNGGYNELNSAENIYKVLSVTNNESRGDKQFLIDPRFPTYLLYLYLDREKIQILNEDA